MNKVAFQLSVSFLVMLIISVVIFGGAIVLVKKFFSSTQKIQTRISAEIEQEIERRLVESGEQVSVPLNKARLSQKESHTFGLGILNMLGTKRVFGISMGFDRAFDQFNNLIQPADRGYINQNWIFGSMPPVEIKNNDYAIVPLPVIVGTRMSEDSTTAPGTYIFNVCVFKGEAQACEKGATNLYPESRISKVYVEVE